MNVALVQIAYTNKSVIGFGSFVDLKSVSYNAPKPSTVDPMNNRKQLQNALVRPHEIL